MKSQKTLTAKQITTGIVVSIVVLVAAHLALQFIDTVILNQNNLFITELANRFDLDDESSVATWASAILLWCLSVSAFFVAKHRNTAKQQKTVWSVIAAVALLLSIDEIATLHETVLQLTHIGLFGWGEQSIGVNAWWYIMPFILLAGIGLVVFIARRLDARTVRLLAIAGAVYISGAVLVEALSSSFVAAQSGFWATGLLVALEEGAELIGVSIALYTTLTVLESQGAIAAIQEQIE